jgi:hypothetical protein
MLWRVLESVGYIEAPRYFWAPEETNGHRWYSVRVIVPAHANRPQWLGWSVESTGETPCEGAQVAAFEVLSKICQNFGDELVNGPAASFPHVDPSETMWW